MQKLIVGLGNPGAKYKYTRHNVGFIVLDHVVKAAGFKKWRTNAKLDAQIIVDKGTDAVYIKPQSFMNNSGMSVAACAKYYDIVPKNIIIIHDDVDLSFGEVKKQFDAGSAGHNGVEDIISKLHTKTFWRIRIGIGRPTSQKIDTSDWVLANFSKPELQQLEALIAQIQTQL